MYLGKWAILMVGAFSMVLLGCSREVHRYDYKWVELNLLDGHFIINVIGHYGKNYEEKGKKKLDFGEPYNIIFDYVVKPNDALTKLVVKDIQLTGEKTGSKHMLTDIQGDGKVRVYGERKLIRISAGPLMAEGYEYQNYTLKATVIVYKTEADFEEQDISVLLETNYSKEWRSDWFDEIMSV